MLNFFCIPTIGGPPGPCMTAIRSACLRFVQIAEFISSVEPGNHGNRRDTAI